MNGDPCLRTSLLEGPEQWHRASISRQQRGMDIEATQARYLQKDAWNPLRKAGYAYNIGLICGKRGNGSGIRQVRYFPHGDFSLPGQLYNASLKRSIEHWQRRPCRASLFSPVKGHTISGGIVCRGYNYSAD